MGFSNIEPKLAEKIKNAKTEAELERLAKEEGCELSDDMLSGIVGGIDMPELPDERIDCHGFFIS